MTEGARCRTELDGFLSAILSEGGASGGPEVGTCRYDWAAYTTEGAMVGSGTELSAIERLVRSTSAQMLIVHVAIHDASGRSTVVARKLPVLNW